MIRSTDLYMVQALQYMLADLRRNQFLLNDIIGDVLTDPLLSRIYGAKELEKIKKFIKKNIQVNMEYMLDMARLPAIAVRIGGGVEDVSATGDVLGDGYESESVPANTLAGVMPGPRIVVGPFTAISYDKNTGKVVVPDTVSLKRVFAGMQLYDEVNQKAYEIVLVDSDTSFYLKPKLKSKINLNNATIRSPYPDKAIHTKRYWQAREQITLTCLAVDPVEVIYLYQIVLYLIGRHRIELFEGANYRVATISYGPLQRMLDDPNIIFGREINLNGVVLHSYIEKTARPIDGITSKPYIADMGPTPDAVWDESVKNQGWAGEKDIEKDLSD